MTRELLSRRTLSSILVCLWCGNFLSCGGAQIESPVSKKSELENVNAAATPHPSTPGSTSPAWTYENQDKWASLAGNEDCGKMHQSPIEIATGDLRPGTKKWLWRNMDAVLPLSMENAGETIKVNVATKNGSSDPQIEYEGRVYFLIQFHFHVPSEHTVDGKSSALELHLVHRSIEGALAVIGVMYDAGSPHSGLEKLWAQKPAKKGMTSTAPNVNTSPAEWLPSSRAAYHYSGSLTIPKCQEGVEWFVLKEHKSVSPNLTEQIKAAFGPTNRHTQPLYGRTVDFVN